jgi:hypothetical protein
MPEGLKNTTIQMAAIPLDVIGDEFWRLLFEPNTL